MKRHIQVKCPICKGKTQSPSTVSKTGIISSKIQIGIRHCRKCNLLIPVDNLIAFWDGGQVIRPQPQLMIKVIPKRTHNLGVFVAEVDK